MEAVFFRLHQRFATTVVRVLPGRVRRYMEYVSLLNAVCLLAALIYLHKSFVNPKSGPDQCLPTALRRAGVDPSLVHVLQIHLEQRQPSPHSYTKAQHCQIPAGSVDSGCAQPGAGLGASQSLLPFKYYSIEAGTGRDAVGTASGPGTLRIEGPEDASNAGEVGEDAAAAAAAAAADAAAGDQLTTINAASSRGDLPQELQPLASSSCRDESRSHTALLSPFSWRLPLWSLGESRGERDTVMKGGPSMTTRLWRSLSDRRDAGREGQDTCGHGSGGHAQGGVGSNAGQVTEGCFVPDKVYLFSLEKGFLMLRQDLRAQHGIVATNVTVPIWDDCFGTPISKWALEWVIGYDTVVMNWLISLYNGKGFLYSVSTKELFNLNYADEFLQSTEDWDKFVVFKVGVLFTTVFLFFTTTTLVSFTLRETQERMLRFTFLLQHHIRNRQPYAPLIFTHVVESLVFVPIMVGILFFLFEFFSDQLLAFMVLSVVWMCEVYSVISVRTSTSIRFFPRVVSFYFALFHVYFFSFPFGFSYLALVSTVLFLQHSMLYFWNRSEVPALQSRAVSISRPRMGGVISIRTMHPGQARALGQAESQWHAAHPGATDPTAAVVDDLYHTRTPGRAHHAGKNYLFVALCPWCMLYCAPF
eukprot:TRINITY_DN423_c0_g1_i2.p1 TRINITY_DN423_c0_g1~~TRINITY_DN423_c0_g1_i2.p1  ORF type:complete len:643 (-),score=123.27 TRINITY_DN423_c0_g1_i2:1424-3352(-)